MAVKGIKKTWGVLSIFVLIGILTALWRASGTISFLVYYGIGIVDPRFFVLFAFVLSSFVSYALGTCFGTAGTMGVCLMVLGRSGGADPVVTAGAILSGSLFGDRCAPVSSSANLVATLTETHLYDNVRNMFRTGLIPGALSLLIYLYLSLQNPMQGGDTAILSEIASSFDLGLITALPALLVLALPLMKVNVKPAILLSILASAAICLWVQNMPVAEMLRTIFMGYVPPTPGRFAQIIAGGGLYSMVRIIFIVLIASTYSGIFDGAELLVDIQSFLKRAGRRIALFPTLVMTSIVTCMLACNQTLGVILAHQLMGKIYKERDASNTTLAADLENSAILIAGLIPWNTACAVTLTMLSADTRSIPWAVYLWLVPLVNLIPRLRPKLREK